MPNLILGLVLLYLLLAAIKYFARLSPTVAARLVRQGGGAIGLLGALLLLLRGRVGVAAALAGASAAFAGWGGKFANFVNPFHGVAGFGAGASKVSSARSAMLEMQLDQTSGAISGVVLSGAFAGRALEALARPDLLALHAELSRDDPDGAALLETYLDRRFAGWRQADEGQGQRRGSGAGAMTRQEALEVLGLTTGAGAEDVIRAHRSLMKKLHPDHGGSTALAARVNQAKDVLLQRHG